MNKSRSNVFIMLNLIVSFFISACSSPREQVKIENGTFNINGKDVQLICGEMHYPRIPHEYWRDRLHRARAMGLNTVSAYVFWNFHERQPGVLVTAPDKIPTIVVIGVPVVKCRIIVMVTPNTTTSIMTEIGSSRMPMSILRLSVKGSHLKL